LGQPLYANRHAIDNLDGRHLHRHLTDNFVSKNMTIVGTGMEHSQLKEVVSSLFSDVSLQGDFFEFQRLGALPVDTPSSQVCSVKE
jgi:hypothetical protein